MNKKRIDWTVTLFLILNPLFSLVLLAIFLSISSIPLSVLIFSLLFAAATNLSITAGYHRLFAHRSYEAHPVLKVLLLLVGASAFQGSALKWSSDHRRHHSHEDTPNDPYSIKKGFWYAHMGWMFYQESGNLEIKARDLEKDWWIQNQHKHYLLWSIGMGFLFPTVFGWLCGSAFAGLVVGGALRIFITQQSTFFVNSLCHYFGSQPYSKEITARDSFIVAILTHGEGYHNFHHKFQLDYRNGIRWYHWDPTKWMINFFKWLGLAKRLKTISAQEILKARLQVEALIIKKKGLSQEKIESLRLRILEAQNQWKQLGEEYDRRKNQFTESSQVCLQDLQLQIKELKLQIKRARADFKFSMEEWKLYTNTISKQIT
jgi:stearoyl-CoA desaturase (delta-9 desaturase)